MSFSTGLPRLRIAQLQGYLVGGFVVLQLLFLTAANVLPMLPQRAFETDEITDDITAQGRTFDDDWLQNTLELSTTAARKYGEASGQMQNWSLFAPGIASQSTFPVVELQWHDTPTSGSTVAPRSVPLPSVFLPENPEHFIRPPGTDCRLFNYEFRMTHPLWFCTEQSLQQMPDVWEQWIATRVSRQRSSLQAYLQWKTQQYLHEHPQERFPDRSVLLVRCFSTVPPGMTAPEKLMFTDRPLVRLEIVPAASRERTTIQATAPTTTLHWFNPVKKQWQALPSLNPVQENAHAL